MDIEKLYQDVWARVFAREIGDDAKPDTAASIADYAARSAVERFDFAKAHAVISAKAKQS